MVETFCLENIVMMMDSSRKFLIPVVVPKTLVIYKYMKEN